MLNLVPLTVDFAEMAVKRYGANEAARRMLDPEAIYCQWTGAIMVGETARRYAEKHALDVVTGDCEDGIDADRLRHRPGKRPLRKKNCHLL